MDQGMFLLRAKEIWNNKELVLIGPTASPMVQGRQFFQGPLIYYGLVGLMLISNWNPIIASGWLIVFNLIGLYFIWRLSKKAAILATFLPISIYFSKFIWNPNVLLILAPVYWFLVSKKKYFWSGLVAGIMLQFHFQVGLVIVATSGYWLMTNWKKIFIYLLGIGIGYSPLILFDLRNNFYNLSTILLWLRTGGDQKFGLQTYYFLAWLPLIYVGMVKIIEKFKFEKLIWGGIMVGSLIWTWQTKSTNDMPKNFDYNKLEQTRSIILADNPSEFNIVNKLSGDTRFYPLRYLLTAKGSAPMEVYRYPEAKTLYVVTNQNDELSDSVWEVSSFKPKTVEKSWDLVNDIKLLKLRK